MSQSQIAEISEAFMSLYKNNGYVFENHEGCLTTGVIFSHFYLNDDDFNKSFVKMICHNLKGLSLIYENGNILKFQFKNRKIDLQYFKNNQMILINLKLLKCEISKCGG